MRATSLNFRSKRNTYTVMLRSGLFLFHESHLLLIAIKRATNTLLLLLPWIATQPFVSVIPHADLCYQLRNPQADVMEGLITVP